MTIIARTSEGKKKRLRGVGKTPRVGQKKFYVPILSAHRGFEKRGYIIKIGFHFINTEAPKIITMRIGVTHLSKNITGAAKRLCIVPPLVS